MFTPGSLAFASAIDNYCKQNGIPKAKFHKDSGISSASLSQWRQEDYVVSQRSVQRIAEYTGMPVEDFMTKYGPEQTKRVDDIADLREEVRRRPEVAFMLRAAKNVPASVILEVAAKLERWKEESGID